MKFKKVIFNLLHNFLQEVILQSYKTIKDYDELMAKISTSEVDPKVVLEKEIKQIEKEEYFELFIYLKDGNILSYTNKVDSDDFIDLQNWFGKLKREWYLFYYNVNGLPCQLMFKRDDIKRIDLKTKTKE